MTKEEIITRLQNAAKEDEEYYMDDDLIDAINEYPEPFELVEPILEIIGTHPRVDFGMPGDLVHFLEQFYKHGYEELLVSSVRKNPTAHNIWMVHRCFNDVNNPKREMFVELMKELKDDSSISMDIKKEIDEFDWEIWRVKEMNPCISRGSFYNEFFLKRNKQFLPCLLFSTSPSFSNLFK